MSTDNITQEGASAEVAEKVTHDLRAKRASGPVQKPTGGPGEERQQLYGRLVPPAMTQIHGSYNAGLLLSEKMLRDAGVKVVPDFPTSAPLCDMCVIEENAWFTFNFKKGRELVKTLNLCGTCCQRKDSTCPVDKMEHILNSVIVKNGKDTTVTIQNHLRQKGDIFPGRVVLDTEVESEIKVSQARLVVGRQEVAATRTAVRQDGRNVYVTFYYDFENGSSPSCQSYLPSPDVIEATARLHYLSSKRKVNIDRELSKLKNDIASNQGSAALFSTKNYLGKPVNGKIAAKFYQVPIYKAHVVLESDKKGSLVPGQNFIITARCQLEWEDGHGKHHVRDAIFTNTNATTVRAHQQQFTLQSTLWQPRACEMQMEASAKKASSAIMKSAMNISTNASNKKRQRADDEPEVRMQKQRCVSTFRHRDEEKHFSESNRIIAEQRIKISEQAEKIVELERTISLYKSDVLRLRKFEEMLTGIRA